MFTIEPRMADFLEHMLQCHRDTLLSLFPFSFVSLLPNDLSYVEALPYTTQTYASVQMTAHDLEF